MKKIISIFLVLLLVKFNLFACTGARQNAMGFAGVTIVNDPHAVYWNQAVLPSLKTEIMYSFDSGDVDKYRYDDVLSVSFPVPSLGIGIGYQYIDSYSRLANSDIEDMEWNSFSIGVNIIKDDNFLWAIGAGVIYIEKISYVLNITQPEKETYYKFPISSIISTKSLILNDDIFRLGFLLQTGKDTFNFRPGISWTIQDIIGSLTLSTTYYNLDNRIADFIGGREKFGISENYVSSDGIRAGLEQTINLPLNIELAARIGMTHNPDLTYGFGVSAMGFVFNYSHTEGSNKGWGTDGIDNYDVGVKFNF